MYEFLVSPEALAEFIRRIETAGVSNAEFTHAAHLAVGAYYAFVHRDRAFEHTKAAILRQNAASGTENTETSGYHETLTRFWSELLQRETAGEQDPYQAAKLAVSKFGDDRGLPLRYYSFDVVASREARKRWIPPDIVDSKLE
jgi:hypothetical protein